MVNPESSLESISPSGATEGASSTRLSPWLAVRVLIVRLRFFLVLLGVLLLVGAWPSLHRFWQRLTGAGAVEPKVVIGDVEFWCPMCPGVVSDFPGKCPVCNMALVSRRKGEAVPLPDGVLARMQFSPYRVQLAGIRTAPVEYRSLRREVVLVGLAERPTVTSPVGVRAEVFSEDAPFLTEGQSVEASAKELPGHPPFRGRIVRLDSEPAVPAGGLTLRLEIDDPDNDLRSGMLVTARAEAPLSRLPWWRRALTEEGCKESAAIVALHMFSSPGVPLASSGMCSALRQAGRQALIAEGYGLSVLCSAVIDHGSRKVVFVENGPGMFDAVEIEIGPRCGDYYPVLRGLDAEQRVAVTGAFLLDAEMWLNHGLATAYFGASRNGSTPGATAPAVVPGSLTEEDRQLVAKQKICPVSGEPLDSMGGPVRVVVAGRTVFICCKGCEEQLRKEPRKYLSKLPAK